MTENNQSNSANIIDTLQEIIETAGHFTPKPVSTIIDSANVIIDVQQERGTSPEIPIYKVVIANIAGGLSGGVVLARGMAITVELATASAVGGGIPGAIVGVAIFYQGSIGTVKGASRTAQLTHDEVLNLLTSPGYIETEDAVISRIKDIKDSIMRVLGEAEEWIEQPSTLSELIPHFTQTEKDNLKDYYKNLLFSANQELSSTIQSLLTSLSTAEASSQIRRVDPLVLDLDNDGIELIPLANSTVFFDLDNDGFKENVGWISGDDGILALDNNGNGVVDNIDELFGERKSDGSIVTGTEELARDYDLNHDGLIDNADAVYNNLRLWRDINGNGISESNELSSLAANNIKAINLNVTQSGINLAGNVILSTGNYERINIDAQGNGSGVIANLDLAINQTNSTTYSYIDGSGNAVGGYDLNLEAVFLPLSRGYGNVKAWHIAVSLDPTLLSELHNLSNLSFTDANFSNIEASVEQFIYRWVGVENINGMRGVFDAKKLAALEAIRGVAYQDNTGGHDVQPWQVGLVEAAWHNLVNEVKNKILIQGTFREIFTGAVYDFASDSIKFPNLDKTQLLNNITSEYHQIPNYIDQLYFIGQISHLLPLTVGKITGITSFTQIKNDLAAQIGISFDDIIAGGDGDDNLNSFAGNDVLVMFLQMNEHLNKNFANDNFLNQKQNSHCNANKSFLGNSLEIHLCFKNTKNKILKIISS